MLNLNVPDTKYLGNLGHYEKTKIKNNRNKRRFQLECPENIFHKIIEENFPNLKKWLYI